MEEKLVDPGLCDNSACVVSNNASTLFSSQSDACLEAVRIFTEITACYYVRTAVICSRPALGLAIELTKNAQLFFTRFT